MQVVYGVENYIANRQRLILALGNFDGLHLAHRKIIKRTKEKAAAKNLPSAIFPVSYTHLDVYKRQVQGHL